MSEENIQYFTKFSDGATTYAVEDETARGDIEEHTSKYVNSNSGSHGLKFDGGTLTYYNTTEESWKEIKTGGVVELTSADYQQLSEIEKNSNIFYVITDGESDDQGNVLGIFHGATTTVGGSVGIVPAPSAGENNKLLCGDGTWKSFDDAGGTSLSSKISLSDLKTVVASSTDFADFKSKLAEL